MSERTKPVREKWSAPQCGADYRGARFASSRAARRDPALVGALLRKHGARGPILDAPCGTGRLQEVLASGGQLVAALDASASMLAEAREAARARCVLGTIEALPFRDRSFDVVVACRFLHHLREPRELERALGELVRVSSRLVIASFWDASSWPALRVRLGWKRAEGADGRSAIARETLEQHLARAGARAIEYRSVLRFVSQQTFFVAERR